MQRAVAPRLDALRPGLRAAGLIPAALAVATAVAFLPVLGSGFVDLGHELLDAGDPEAALGHFRRALEIRPDRVGSYRSLGLALEALGRRDAAIDAYERGLALSPRALAIRLSLATALLASGQLGGAVVVVDAAWSFHDPTGLARYFEAAARHRPEAPVARLGLVRAWLTLGEVERARAEFEVLRRLHPDLAAVVAAAGGSS